MHELVEKAQRGDLEAFGRLVERFQDAVFGAAYALVGNFHDAQDLAQESFIRAWSRLDKLRDPDRFPGWLYRITRNCCLDFLRRRETGAVPLSQDNVPASDVPTAPETLEKAEMREAVLDAIRSLSEPNRLATTLFYIDGYTVEEVAQFLEVPPGTVKRRLHDSRQRLKERMVVMVGEELNARKPGPELEGKVREAIALQQEERFAEAVSAHLSAVKAGERQQVEAQALYDSFVELFDSYKSAQKLHDFAEGMLNLPLAPSDDESLWTREKLAYAGHMFVAAREPERAVELIPRMTDLGEELKGQPQYRWHLIETLCIQLEAAATQGDKGQVAKHRGDVLDALNAYEEEVRARHPDLSSARDTDDPEAQEWFRWLGHAYHSVAWGPFNRYRGDKAAALSLMRRASELRDADATELILAQLTLSVENDREKSLEHLHRAFGICASDAQREFFRTVFRTAKDFEPVREDPEFLAVVEG